ncbi:putative Histidine kinase [Bradyrhizobium sp. STM 3843]|uniref:PAS domain S-box protein n=1 Tax=Bradyrhizobium sp. STM 3843 TaxID=551947 RepID=UPI0002407244|nr:PAS domain S-box protein [Bradyrhizobium sp. STM 3843]CCE06812.1 putative Histidine kinase [Bradyrhizobium sp. STM 3843]
MTSPLHILLLESDTGDAKLIQELLTPQFAFELTHARTREEFAAALGGTRFDLILADYSLPSFDGLSALELALARSPDVPFIFVSGSIGEDAAVEALKRGATDYVLKTRLSRLVPATQRALRQAEQRADLEAAQQSLRRSEIYLAQAEHIAHVGWWERDFATRRVSLSDETCRIFGVERVDLPGWHGRWLELIHPEDRSRAAEAAAAARAPGGPRYDIEYRIIRPDGSLRLVHSQGDVSWDDLGRPLRQFGVMQDITELRQAKQDLRASEMRFRTFVDHATDAFFLLDDQSLVIDANRQACADLGYTRQELIGMHRRDFDVALDEPSIESLKGRVVAGEAVTFETRYRRKDGSTFPVEARVGHFEESGHRFSCVARDITERKHAEQALRISEERFRTLVQFSFDVYWESDAQHRFTRQEFAERLTDAPAPGSEIGKTRWEIPYVEPDAEAWRKHRETLDAHLPFRDFVLARPTPDGGKRFVSVSGLPVFDEAGRFVGYRGVGRHITEQKKAEEALRRSQAYLAEAQRLSNSGAFAFNKERSLYWSEQLYRIWGFDPEDEIPSRDAWWQRVHPDDRDNARQELQNALREKHDFAMEYRIVLPDGTLKHLRTIGHPSYTAAGDLVEVVGTTLDVTERKRAQAEHQRLRELEADLAHLNRLSIMGELTASLAHEILHPIATARNNARAGMRFLAMNPPDLPEVMDALACVVRDADRAKDIVARIRDHIRKKPPRKERFEINDAITEVIVMARNVVDMNHVSVQTSFRDPMPALWGDRVQVQQVILNLLLNAAEAMSSMEGSRQLSISTDWSEPDGLLVEVRDSGPGLAQEQLQDIFKAFYTTKPSGIGMGLSICRSIVDAHGGRLWAEANHPRGAVFRLTLPAAEAGS